MALELMKLGTEAVIAVASGLADPPPVGGFGLQPISFGAVGSETRISYGAVTEAVALVAGVGMQLLMPFTLPDVAEGLTDAGLVLLAHRMTHELTHKPGGLSGGVGPAPVVAFPYNAQFQPYQANPAVAPWAGAAARPSVGSIAGLPKVNLS